MRTMRLSGTARPHGSLPATARSTVSVQVDPASTLTLGCQSFSRPYPVKGLTPALFLLPITVSEAEQVID